MVHTETSQLEIVWNLNQTNSENNYETSNGGGGWGGRGFEKFFVYLFKNSGYAPVKIGSGIITHWTDVLSGSKVEQLRMIN